MCRFIIALLSVTAVRFILWQKHAWWQSLLKIFHIRAHSGKIQIPQSELLSAISPLNFPANIGFPCDNLQFLSWFKPWILNRFCRMGKWSATAIRFQVYARWETFCPKP
jgi:hypothetical protein